MIEKPQIALLRRQELVESIHKYGGRRRPLIIRLTAIAHLLDFGDRKIGTVILIPENSRLQIHHDIFSRLFSKSHSPIS